MSLSNVPKLKEEDTEGNLKNIIDYLSKLKQELEFQLLNLDSDNISQLDAKIVKVKNLQVGENITIGNVGKKEIEDLALSIITGTYIDENGVWTPEVYANNLNVLKGKILAAQIENLEVGSNVTMGPNAVIEWKNLPPDVADKGDIPEVPGYITSTKITRTTIESPEISGGKLYQQSMFQASGNIEISEGGIHFLDKSDRIAANQYVRTSDNAVVMDGTKMCFQTHVVIDKSNSGKLTDEKGADLGGTAVFG